MYIIAFSHGDLNVKWELNCVVRLRVDTHFSLSYLQTYNMSAILHFDLCWEIAEIISRTIIDLRAIKRKNLKWSFERISLTQPFIHILDIHFLIFYFFLIWIVYSEKWLYVTLFINVLSGFSFLSSSLFLTK